MTFLVRRVYEPRRDTDGHRILVDRLWPRGIAKEPPVWDEWLKAAAPTSQLRRWYGHLPDRFSEFARRYRDELDGAEHAPALDHLWELEKRGTVTLLTAAKNIATSHMPILEEKLNKR